MKSWSSILLMGVILVFLVTPSSKAFAKTQGYCLECHSKESIKSFTLPESRSIYHAKLDPCPGVRALCEEIFFTESRIIALDRILQNIDEEGRTRNILINEVSKTSEALPDLKGEKSSSVANVKKNALNLRSSLQKVYDRTLQIRDGSDRQWLIGVGSLIFLGLVLLIGVGYWKLNRMSKVLLILFFLGTLASTSCSFGPAEPKKKSPAQEALERALWVADQSTKKTEEAFYQSVLLSEMAGDWSKIESGPAEKAFELAWERTLKAKEKAGEVKKLQGFVSQYPDHEKAVEKKVNPIRNSSGALNPAGIILKSNPDAEQRGIISNGVNFDTVLDLRDELRNGEGRTWALRGIAEEWMKVNKNKGRKSLEFLTREALAIRDGELRDRELKSIAMDWTGVDETRALEIGRSIRDPFIKSMALTHIAKEGRKGHLFEEAWKMAETLVPSYSQAKAFIRISATTARIFPNEKGAWAKRVSEKIKELKHPQMKAYAMQDLILHWAPLDREQSERWVAEISPLFPEIRAYALIQIADHSGVSKEKSLSLLKNALSETSRVTDPFEVTKIKYLIARNLIQLESEEALRILPQIQDLFYRSEILGKIAKQFSVTDKKKGLPFAEKIPLEPFRMRATVGIISQWMDQERGKIVEIYQKTLPVALSISDPYRRALTLIQMGKDWKRLEQGKEIFLFDLALRTAREIPSLPLRTEILESLSEEWKNLDRKKSQTIMDEIDSSVIWVRKLLEEIQLWSKTDPSKALSWADTFPPSFPMEKAMAQREVAIAIQRENPSLSMDLLERSLNRALVFPEGPKQRKLLLQWVKEMASLNKERTLQRLLQIEDPDIRDLLLREAGNGLIKEDPSWATKVIREISESSLRIPLYQKIADEEGKTPPSKRPELSLFHHWGLGRLKAKKDELQAIPHYEKALQEIEKISHLHDQSYLLSALATDWTLIHEEKALKVAQKIHSDHFEPLSYALLQIGTQLRKWNRKEAHPVFQRAVSSASQIQKPLLRAKRLLQIAQEWQALDQEKGKEILKRAEREIRKYSPLCEGEGVLYEILLAQTRLESGNIFTIAQQCKSPFLRSKILLENAKRLSKMTIEENIKSLETAYQYAQTSKNLRLMAEIGEAWFSLDKKKGVEIIDKVDSKEIRLKSLRRIIKKGDLKKEEVNGLLRQATQEALEMDDPNEKVKALKEIAHDWTSVNKGQAKNLYHMAYRLIKERGTF